MSAAVRVATTADIPTLVEMRREWTFEDNADAETTRGDFEEAMASLLTAGIADRSWRVFVAEDGGELVAHMYVRLVEKVPRPVPGKRYIAYVTNVYTRPDRRGRGIGGRILTHIQAWAREESVELLFVWPSDESVGFWRRHGFEPPSDLLVWEP
jgi:GNAT superfamily N-acetyltransferase